MVDWTEYKWLAKWLCKQKRATEDQRQDVDLALWLACQRVESGAGSSRCYLRRAMTWALREREAQTIQARAEQTAVELEPWHLVDQRRDDDVIDGGRAAALLRRLPPRTQHILVRQLIEGADATEVAAELGLSHERVRQLRVEALEKLRKQMEGKQHG